MSREARRVPARIAHPSPRARRPKVEGLEDRFLLYAANGGHWQFPSRVTYSFAPDGTNIGGISNDLNVSLSSLGISTASWQAAVNKAAVAWEAIAGVNLVQVTDNGADFGDSTGNQQGDSHYGDIRIGGIGLSSSVLAEAFLPPAYNGGSLAGDIVFNTNQPWRVGADYDIQTVAMHEFGHALGLDHSSDSTATMYPNYTGTDQVLAADDKSGMQSVYGTRQPDAFDAVASNQTLATASNITPFVNAANLQVSIPGLDIGTTSDLDYYKVVVPAGANSSFTVKMQSTGLSSLSPRLFVLNSVGNLVSNTYSTAFGATLSINISGVSAGQTYYFRAQGSSSGSSGVGGYGLQVNFGGSTQAAIAPPNTTVAAQADQGGGSSFELNGHGSGVGDFNFNDQSLQIGSLRGVLDALTIGARRYSPILEHSTTSATVSHHQALDHAIAAWTPEANHRARARHRRG